MPHSSAGPLRPTVHNPGLLCRSGRLLWVVPGQVRYRSRPWQPEAVLVVGLAVTAAVVLLFYRDVWAALVCAGTAVMVLRDRARRCSACTAQRPARAGGTPALALMPSGMLPHQRQRRV